MKILTELKRRNVAKVAIFYLITGWLILQAGDVLFELLQVPDWTLRLVFGVLILGFPVVLVFSWIFEITPEGIKRETEIDRSVSIAPKTGQKINLAIVAGLVLVGSVVAWQQFRAPPPEVVPVTGQSPAEETSKPEPVAADATPSVAVLPFVNMSPDKDQDYFADGLSDTLMHVLAQVRGLKVAARTSSFAYKGKNINVSEIARELKVATILEGSVLKSGERVRVIAQLIEATHGTHLWSANFDRELTDIFAIQDEIAREVVVALKLQLLAEDQTRLAERYQPSLESYEQFMLGRQEMEKRTAKSLAAAEMHFKQAIDFDTEYALAYVGLANTYDLQASYSDLSREESRRLRVPLVEKALALDPLSGEVHVSKAALARFGEFEQAEKSFLRAIELAPSYARAYHWYANDLGNDGRLDDALLMIRKAMELDPLSPIIRRSYATSLFELGRVEEALVMVREGIQRNPDFPNYYGAMRSFSSQLGRIGEARRWGLEYSRKNPNAGWGSVGDCFFQVEMADDLGAGDCIERNLPERADRNYMISLQLSFNRARGDFAANRRILDRALELWAEIPRFVSNTKANKSITEASLGNLPAALALMGEAHPELFSEGSGEVDEGNWKNAIWAAWILKETGDSDRWPALLDQAEVIIASRHRTRGLGYGIQDVVALLIRGNPEDSLTKLREAIDAGWREDWRSALNWDVRLAPIRNDPRFIAMVGEVAADIAAQREWFEANRDTPVMELQ